MYKISDEFIKFITENMKNWKEELIAGRTASAEVKIQRGIFQVDTLSTLTFPFAIFPKRLLQSVKTQKKMRYWQEYLTSICL